MDCNFAKLDHGPGAYASERWRDNPAQCDSPTGERPATWNRPRKNKIAPPATGEPKPDIYPPRGKAGSSTAEHAPATGAKAPISAVKVPPPRGTFLETPSAVPPDQAGRPIGARRPSSDAQRSPAENQKFERVRDCEQDTARFDSISGECLPAIPAPARANKRAASAWVNAVLGEAGKPALADGFDADIEEPAQSQ